MSNNGLRLVAAAKGMTAALHFRIGSAMSVRPAPQGAVQGRVDREQGWTRKPRRVAGGEDGAGQADPAGEA